MTLIEKIQELMLNDTEDQSDRLQLLYEAASPVEQALIDQVLVCLCGYSLKTIIAGDA